jgi:hypothetical protein
VTNDTIKEFLTALRYGELDSLVPEIELIVLDRQHAIELRRAQDDLARMQADVNRFVKAPRDEQTMQSSYALFTKLRRWIKAEPENDALYGMIDRLAREVFGLHDFNYRDHLAEKATDGAQAQA